MASRRAHFEREISLKELNPAADPSIVYNMKTSKTLRQLFVLLAAAMALAAPLAAQTKTAAQIGLGSAISPGLAASATGYLFVLGGKAASPLSASFAFNEAAQRWQLVLDSSIYKKTSIGDGRGALIGGEFSISNADFAKSLGLDSQIIRIKNNSIIIENYLAGKKKSEAKIALDKPITDIDMLPILLPGIIKNGGANKDFNMDVLIKSKGLRLNADLGYLAPGSGEVAKEAAKTPPEFQSRLKNYASVHCYRLHPTGIIGLISGSFYLLYADDAEKSFIGYFGGSGSSMEGLILDRR